MNAVFEMIIPNAGCINIIIVTPTLKVLSFTYLDFTYLDLFVKMSHPF